MITRRRTFHLEMKLPNQPVIELIPDSLFSEVLNTLPESGVPSIRATLKGWETVAPNQNEEAEISRDELYKLAQALTDFAHEDRGELGVVGRMPRSAGGQIMDIGRLENSVDRVSSTLVLALALRRLLLLGHAIGTRFLLQRREL